MLFTGVALCYSIGGELRKRRKRVSMLFRYQDKEIRVTTEDGSVFTGIAEVFPSGYGLHEFDREEEGIQVHPLAGCYDLQRWKDPGLKDGI